MRQIHNLFSKVYRKQTKKNIFVLGIMASPRQGGNSDILLDRALESAHEQGARTEKIILNDLNVKPCQACPDCSPESGLCVVKDDFQKVYAKIVDADALIVASPIYFGSVSAQLKIIIDRFQCYWQAKYVLKTITELKGNKKGAFICVQASNKNEFFDNAGLIVKNFFVTIGVQYSQELFCPELAAAGEVMKHADILVKAANLAGQLVKEG